MTRAKQKKRSWIVTGRATVIKELILEGCTEEQARTDPWEFIVNEHDTEIIDWELRKVESNE